MIYRNHREYNVPAGDPDHELERTIDRLYMENGKSVEKRRF